MRLMQKEDEGAARASLLHMFAFDCFPTFEQAENMFFGNREDYVARHHKAIPKELFASRKALIYYFEKKIGIDVYSLFDLIPLNFILIQMRNNYDY